MAVNLETVTGNVETLTGGTPSLARLWFKLSRPDWNADGEIFAPEYVEAICDSGGAFSVNLQSTDDLEDGATYRAILKYREPLDGRDREYVLASFAVPNGGPWQLSDLLTTGAIEPVPSDVLALCVAAQVSAETASALALAAADELIVTAANSTGPYEIWNGAVSYEAGRRVLQGRLLYYAVAASTGVTPGTDVSKWALVNGEDDSIVYRDVPATFPVGMPKITRVAQSNSTAFAGGAVTIPYDNTVPLITEGGQWLSGSWTPATTAMRYTVELDLPLFCVVGGRLILALFVDSTCVGAWPVTMTAGAFLPVRLTSWNHDRVVSDTAVKTVSLRVGTDGTGNFWMGRDGTGALFGSINGGSLTVVERFI